MANCVVLSCRGYQELLAISAAIQMVLSTPVGAASALKGIQKTLGKALPFKVSRPPLAPGLWCFSRLVQ